jgi:peptidoglycan/xylan/chitin deacetylase (PgdA/CDA1 family)
VDARARWRAVGGLIGLLAAGAAAYTLRDFQRFRSRFVPLLMYHGITDNLDQHHENYVRRGAFEQQMRWLVEHGYRPVGCGELLQEGAHRDGRLVGVTFDDGLSSNYHLGLPIIKALGVGCTIFATTDFIDQARPFPWDFARDDPPLSWEQARELLAAGVEIQSHGCSHPSFPDLSPSALERELTESRRIIGERLGVMPTMLAYPYGHYNDAVKAAVRNAGYAAAFAVNVPAEAEDRFAIARINIRNQTTLIGFRLRVWGVHSYLKTRRWFRLVRPLLQRFRQSYF